MSVKILPTFAALVLAGCVSTLPQPASIATPAPFSAHQEQCAGKNGWSDPAPPVRIYGNVYDVGTCGIVALLIASPDGHILIDGATDEAAPAIAANIERLGFALRDVRIIASTHEHFDHVGGLPELQRMTGAQVVARAPAKNVLESGIVATEDPQSGLHPPFATLRVDRIIGDGENIRVGSSVLTAHATPGHSPGSTSWSWKSCADAGCLSIVYADSISAVSGDAYRFSDHPAYVATFRASLDTIAALDCDLLITPHPAASNLYPRMAGREPLIDPAGCRDYAAKGRRNLDQRLAKEAADRQ